MFESILVANRGEIALRVIRACRDLGIRSIAVFSDADRYSPHVLEADEAYRIGPAPSSESYLNVDRILAAAKEAGASAIHPGYGFLAERSAFARSVVDAGLVFIGPRPETIDAMGDKTKARKRMEAAGVPIVPGVVDAIEDAGSAISIARDVGFPVLLKAVAGGGGKGMRVVENEDGIIPAFEAAAREALASFGDDAVYLEKYLAKPRHIEIQILGDEHGQVIHLGERECSIQRRHQKLIEEAPSAILTAEQRAAMGAAAVQAAQAVDYLGAGTIEFLFDAGEFFFLEMNTRLQVEHPVSELVTGIDLVEWQIRVAAGERLPFTQDDVQISGHAIECRITSEDPYNGFLPSTGLIRHIRVPGGPGVRWDEGVGEGFTVGLHYDPMLAKLIVHGPDRATAISRMSRALAELVVHGVPTSVPFHRRVMEEADFRSGDLTIRYLEDHPDLLTAPDDSQLLPAAVAATLLEQERRERHAIPRVATSGSGLSPWRNAGWPWNSK